jgi:hypothetical protein
LKYILLTASPTVPRPKIATIEPASTFAVFHTAPRPTRLQFVRYIENKTNFGNYLEDSHKIMKVLDRCKQQYGIMYPYYEEKSRNFAAS